MSNQKKQNFWKNVKNKQNKLWIKEYRSS